MKTKEHKVLNHPVLGYFLLMIFSLLVASIISDIIDNKILGNLIPGYAITQNILGQETPMASGVGMAVGSVLVIGLFYIWFRPSFNGMLKKKNLLMGLLLLSPVLIIHWIGSIVSWSQFGTASVLLLFFVPPFFHVALPLSELPPCQNKEL